MGDEATTSGADLTVELYKSLRSEIVSYVEKVPALWFQKFLLVGAAIAFLVGNEQVKVLAGGHPTLVLILATLAFPILAVLLDAKISEYGLHSRAISLFIQRRFPDPAVLADWEACLWGDRGEEEIVSIVKLRSLMTVVVTVAPTMVILVLSGVVMDLILGTTPGYSWGGVGVAAVYGGLSYVMWRRVWPRRKP
jgi:hypothetical protein